MTGTDDQPYVRLQRGFAELSAVLRARLLEACEPLRAVPRPRGCLSPPKPGGS
ncbi:hypothetical protein OERS_14060 [Oerskovia enterophila]|uniref:Uncharacterized protein n=1 Tax=Oerskovia enterophila TaxID=43678 RepID=A0ABX2Y888_9CELL|nr:hypothetical protein OERS_14060 [Oerskovia enterophila]